MNPLSAFFIFFTKAFVISGRASRSEFWWQMLGVVLVSSTLILLLNNFSGVRADYGIFLDFAGFLLTIPILTSQVRRLHDTDRSGWWVLLGLIPFIGSLVLVIWFCSKGSTEKNKFGAPSLQSNKEKENKEKMIGFIAQNPDNIANKTRGKTTTPVLKNPKKQAGSSNVMEHEKQTVVANPEDDDLYEQAFTELEEDTKIIAIWSRSIADALGDQEKARALYIKARVTALKAQRKEKAIQLDAEREAKETEEWLARERAAWDTNKNSYRKLLLGAGFSGAEVSQLLGISRDVERTLRIIKDIQDGQPDTLRRNKL